MKALQAVRVCRMLLAMIPMTRLGGANLQAQVGISSGMAQVALVIRVLRARRCRMWVPAAKSVHEETSPKLPFGSICW